MVGQDVLRRAADSRSQQTFLDAEAILHECRQLQHHLSLQDEIIVKICTCIREHHTGGRPDWSDPAHEAGPLRQLIARVSAGSARSASSSAACRSSTAKPTTLGALTLWATSAGHHLPLRHELDGAGATRTDPARRLAPNFTPGTLHR